MSEREIVTCRLCGEPMPPGEEMFNYHGYSGPCPKPPALAAEDESDEGAARPEGSGDSWAPPLRRPVPLATPQTETLLDVPHAEVDALVEAIYAERRALSPPPDVERLAEAWLKQTFLAKGYNEDTHATAVERAVARILGACSGDSLQRNLVQLVRALSSTPGEPT